MLTITEDAFWTIAPKAREAAQNKSEWIVSSAKVAAELAVEVVADATIEKLSEEERLTLMRRATELATGRMSDLVADLADDLADDFL
jgi:hypothetical protein